MANREQLTLRLVLQGEGHYTYAVGGILVIYGNAGAIDGGRLVRDFIEIIPNALRTGCHLVQLVDVHEDAAANLAKELVFLAEEGEQFQLEKVERGSGYPNWNIRHYPK